jgi:hypothetical protein
MAFSDSKLISVPSGATFAETDLYKGVAISATGGAVLYSAAAASTDGVGCVGTLYSVTSTTVAGQAVSIGVGPVVKAFAAGSTSHAGNIMTWSTDDAHLVAATTNDPWGVVVAGASGSTGRILSVIRTQG